MKRRLFTLLLAGLLGWNGVAAAEELVIYSGRSDRFVKPVVDAFTEKTGIKVVLHSGSSTALLNKLKLEGPRTTADIYISNDAGNLQKGSELKLFQPVTEKLADRIPTNYRAKDNSWIGVSARARVLVGNNNQKDTDFVKSGFDLSDPLLAARQAIPLGCSEVIIVGVSVMWL